MGGAWSASRIEKLFRLIGFTNISITSEEVTEAYARKWGHGPVIREYIQSSLIYAEKPRSGIAKTTKGLRRSSGRGSRRFVAPAFSAPNTDEHAGQKSGDMRPPGDAPSALEKSGEDL